MSIILVLRRSLLSLIKLVKWRSLFGKSHRSDRLALLLLPDILFYCMLGTTLTELLASAVSVAAGIMTACATPFSVNTL